MDLEDSGIDSDPKNNLEFEVPTSNDPIITFSPDRCRFDPGGHKSRNSSIASDFDLELSYSADVNPPSTSLTDLLTTSAPGGQLSSISHSTLNNNLNGVETQVHQSTMGVGDRDLDKSRSQQGFKGNLGISESKSNSKSDNGTNPTSQLKKRLEKQIAQASAISGSTSISPVSKEETEFGEWSSSRSPNVNPNNNKNSFKATPYSKDKSQKGILPGTDSDKHIISIISSHSSNPKNIEKIETEEPPPFNHSNSNSNDSKSKPTCVRFQENEVEIISSKSRRHKVPGGLIPPERLAVPNKAHSNSNSNPNRKQSKGNVPISVINAPHPHQEVSGNPAGNTSEIKPLVQWDSDESEEELSFFPAGKSRVKLTDNLSIDNMSLSGEEDDLHLSPPRPLTQKCPCDPRQWVNDHVLKHTSKQFGSKSSQCRIA